MPTHYSLEAWTSCSDQCEVQEDMTVALHCPLHPVSLDFSLAIGMVVISLTGRNFGDMVRAPNKHNA